MRSCSRGNMFVQVTNTRILLTFMSNSSKFRNTVTYFSLESEPFDVYSASLALSELLSYFSSTNLNELLCVVPPLTVTGRKL